MIYSRITVLALLFVFLVDCGRSPAPPSPLTDRPYDQLADQDENRDSVLRQSRERYSGNTCEDEEEDNPGQECVEDCYDIYESRRFGQDCEELAIRQIEMLVELHDILEDPDDKDLRRIDLLDFEVYLNVSISGFENQISGYSQRQARDVITWLITDPELTDLFSGEDKDFGALEMLFKRLVGDDSFDTYEPFVEKIDRNERLMEVVINSKAKQAEDLWEWFSDYINQEDTECDDDENSGACFRVFCQIGKGIDKDARKTWMRIDAFEEYIEEIVELGVNGHASPGTTQWDTDESDSGIGNVDDVDDFYEQLCKGCDATGETCSDGA